MEENVKCLLLVVLAEEPADLLDHVVEELHDLLVLHEEEIVGLPGLPLELDELDHPQLVTSE
eukprot:5982883-Prorocentrum_lima.AAC.1